MNACEIVFRIKIFFFNFFTFSSVKNFLRVVNDIFVFLLFLHDKRGRILIWEAKYEHKEWYF